MSAAAAVAAETDAPSEGEGTEEETPAEVPVTEDAPAPEGEAPAEGEEAAKPDPTEDDLKAAAEKYTSELFKQANKTMAAARRAEARISAVRSENNTLKGHLQTYAGFVTRLQQGDATALREIGFGTVREFLDAITNHGEPKAETPDDRVARLERQLKEREDAEANAKQEALIAEQQKLVFEHVGGNKERWHYVATTRGNDELWSALGEYYAEYGSKIRPGTENAIVEAVADAVEADMRASLGVPQVSPKLPGAKNGAPPKGETKNSGKTLNNATSAGGAVTRREYSLDPVERKRQVNEDMRAANEI